MRALLAPIIAHQSPALAKTVKYQDTAAECECSVGPSSSCTACVAQQAAHNTLHKVFGFSEFCSGQLEAILPALHG